MIMTNNWRWYLGALVTLGLASAGCSSKKTPPAAGAAGAAVAFSVPTGVDVLKVEDENSSSSFDNTAMDYSVAGTDYANASGHFHVSHPVGEALSTTGEIMCFIGQLGIGNMWSETALPRVYLVGVDDSKCSSDSGQPSQGAASGGATSTAATQLTMVTVRLSREAPGAYPRAEIWFAEADGGGGGASEIRASIDVLQEPSDAFPYGKFNLYFGMMNDAGALAGGGNLLVSGTTAAPIAFTFYESFTHQGQTQTKGASIEMQADGSGLKAAVQSQSPWDGDQAWLVATNASSVLANNKDSGNAAADSIADIDLAGGTCLSKENFKYRIHGYGLYGEDDGAKVSLNTGVSCQYTDGDGNARNCHISTHGAWFEQESDGTDHSFANGDTVTRRSWGDDAAHDGEDITLFVSSGRLNKYTVKKYTLSEIRNMEMRMWDNSNNTEYIVKYQTVAGDSVGADGFYKVATMSWGSGGPPSKTEISPTIVNIANDVWQNFYSDALGGVSFIGGNTFVTARLETLIAPGAAGFTSGTMALKCLNRCPKSGITQANLSTWAGPYETDPANLAAAIDYLVTESDMVLHKGTTSSDPAVALASGVSYSGSGSQYNWGIGSGAMVSSVSGLSDLWAIYDTEGNSYYEYRMGPNNWDKLVLAKDADDNFFDFDEPLSFDYTHTTANDRNGDSAFNGKKFLLRFQGEGHIDGFPWDQIDRDGDGSPDMWFPQVSLKDGVQLTDTDANNYRIKALYGDITLTNTGANCSDIDLALPASDVPTAAAGEPSNVSTDLPDHGDCQFDTTTETASAGC